ncbi:hypothetical protein BGZ65_002432 [Modicella reniformis]|uniref:Homeobox domain-containing protein n=1 Tax=Modicella reniformis TaxID=1440133 RepID=A0A9P6M9J7_9FUNG|nr:hypothetical protein BGZ65_002432 [Modicella reniformis]
MATNVSSNPESNKHAGMDSTPSSANNSNSQTPGGGLDPNRKRRGNLPKSVTSVLKSWLVQNAIHPYPSESEKMRLAEATQLSMNQISNWFINARRRILQPILVEAAAAAAGSDVPVENVLIVRKGKGSRMQVEMEGVTITNANTSAASATAATTAVSATITTTTAATLSTPTPDTVPGTMASSRPHAGINADVETEGHHSLSSEQSQQD